MAIFNKEYIKKYNQKNKEVLNESLLTVGLFIILSPFILLIASIILLNKIADDIYKEEDRKRKEYFSKLIRKYPQLKKAINNIFTSTQDFLVKKIKLKYNILEKYLFEFNEYSFNENTEFKEIILYTNPEKYIKSTPLSKYLSIDASGKYTYNYILDDMNNDRELSIKKYNELYEIYENICNNIYSEFNEIDKYLKMCNDDLNKNPNGNIVKLETSVTHPGENETDFPICFIYIKINVNNVKMTDEIEEKINELRAKSGKYLKN